jgi:preprotein translocase subunit SecD
MSNQYPLWKYLMIVVFLATGFIYALPNLYPPDPAVQISSAESGQEVNQRLLNKVEGALQEANISFFGGEIQKQKSLLVRLNSREDQLPAKRIITSTLGDGYIVALNLAVTTPQWLKNLGAGPLKLGLDLSGGVHFLLEVDTKEALKKNIEGYISSIKTDLREKRIRGRISYDEGRVLGRFTTEALRDKARKLIRKEYPQFENLDPRMDGEVFIQEFVLPEKTILDIESEAVKQNVTTLRNRVNELGVAEPLVQRQGKNRIVVELPGVQDTAQAKKIIGKTANLEFRLEARPSASFSDREQFEFRNKSGQQAWLERDLIVTGDQVVNAQSNFDTQTGQPQVNITLDAEGGKRMNRVTRDNIQRNMGVLFIERKSKTRRSVDESGEEVIKRQNYFIKKIISLATIQSALGVTFRITGLDSTEEASELALLLRAGALAAPIDFVEERTVGPSLGQENIDRGFMSVLIGLALIMVFMLLYYKAFGVLANLALMINIVLLISIMSMFSATLTLPGIAGIVLTVGMAVDANVLIFSRIKEELKSGESPHSAINQGYRHAFTAIIDANITTFIVALILFSIGTGPIKGFAVTLMIGIITSVFTATMVTRALVNITVGKKRLEKLYI